MLLQIMQNMRQIIANLIRRSHLQAQRKQIKYSEFRPMIQLYNYRYPTSPLPMISATFFWKNWFCLLEKILYVILKYFYYFLVPDPTLFSERAWLFSYHKIDYVFPSHSWGRLALPHSYRISLQKHNKVASEMHSKNFLDLDIEPDLVFEIKWI